MKFLPYTLVTGLLLAWASVSVAGQPTLLALLRGELDYEHKSPQGEGESFRCPKNAELLLGASQTLINGSLGQPDLTHRYSSNRSSWTYYFSSTPPTYWSSHYPRLTLYFGPQQQVTRTTCFDYSKRTR